MSALWPRQQKAVPVRTRLKGFVRGLSALPFDPPVCQRFCTFRPGEETLAGAPVTENAVSIRHQHPTASLKAMCNDCNDCCLKALQDDWDNPEYDEQDQRKARHPSLYPKPVSNICCADVQACADNLKRVSLLSHDFCHRASARISGQVESFHLRFSFPFLFHSGESAVGKKLVALTTRRVIILVRGLVSAR